MPLFGDRVQYRRSAIALFALQLLFIGTAFSSALGAAPAAVGNAAGQLAEIGIDKFTGGSASLADFSFQDVALAGIGGSVGGVTLSPFTRLMNSGASRMGQAMRGAGIRSIRQSMLRASELTADAASGIAGDLTAAFLAGDSMTWHDALLSGSLGTIGSLASHRHEQRSR